MKIEEGKILIEKFINAYNSFDIEGMLALLHQEIVFRNFSNGNLDTETKGIEEFKNLAESSAKLFSCRRQTITGFHPIDGRIETGIEYEATLAVDVFNGLTTGSKIQLKGKSVYGFLDEKILLIEDHC